MRVRGLVLGVVGVVAASVVGVVSPGAADDGGVVVTETGEALEVAGSLVEDAAPLADTGDGFVAAVAGSEVELPVDPSEPLVFGGVAGEIGVGLPAVAGVGEGVVDESGAVVYESGAGAVSLAAQATVDGGLQVLVVIDGADAPSEYRFDMSVPAGATLVATADGGAEVVGADGQAMAGVAPAWALDADGQPVPTRYRIEGTTLVQVIDHHGAAYPVVGDPNIGNCGWFPVPNCTIYFNRSETRRIADGTLGASVVIAACGAASRSPWGAVACGIVAANIVLGAQSARSQNKCLKLKVWSVAPYLPQPGSYTEGTCEP
jgi:hypothetical protein